MTETLNPALLGGFADQDGFRFAAIGEEDYTLLLGHHDPAVAWAAYAAWQVAESNWSTVDDEPRDHYLLEQGLATFSRHSEGCADVAKQVCEPCQREDHDACQSPCLCAEDYDHDDEGPSASPAPCSCDEFAWWVGESKSGEPVTWISFDWKAWKAREGLERRGAGAS